VEASPALDGLQRNPSKKPPREWRKSALKRTGDRETTQAGPGAKSCLDARSCVWCTTVRCFALFLLVLRGFVQLLIFLQTASKVFLSVKTHRFLLKVNLTHSHLDLTWKHSRNIDQIRAKMRSNIGATNTPRLSFTRPRAKQKIKLN